MKRPNAITGKLNSREINPVGATGAANRAELRRRGARGRPAKPPTHRHPLLSDVLSLVARSGRTDSDVSLDAGLSRNSISHWRHRTMPGVNNLDAVLRAIGYRLLIVPFSARSKFGTPEPDTAKPNSENSENADRVAPGSRTSPRRPSGGDEERGRQRSAPNRSNPVPSKKRKSGASMGSATKPAPQPEAARKS